MNGTNNYFAYRNNETLVTNEPASFQIIVGDTARTENMHSVAHIGRVCAPECMLSVVAVVLIIV